MIHHRIHARFRPSRPVLLAVACLSATILTSACSAAVPQASPAKGASTVASVAPLGAPVAPLGAPVAAPANEATVASGAGVAQPGVAIAYPFPGFAGTPGIAPDHSIVVTGSGQATIKADQSDRSAAERKAIDLALADAKVQADAIAAATGLTISGVVSVSASVGQTWFGPMPMGAAGSGTGAPGTDGGTIAPAPVPAQPATMDLAVSVTVVYRVG